MRTYTFTCLLLICFFIAPAQKQWNNWCFGDAAGISFNTGSPVTFTGSAIGTAEGCASISDATGQLLFYTDGITVWNKNNTAMSNGTGLGGGYSSTQSAVIIPVPGSTTLYYIFTQDGGFNGLQYSEVDMTLSGGLGNVNSVINVPLLPSCTEKLTAIRQANGIDYWVVTVPQGASNYYVYPVTSAGVGTPVITNIGGIPSSIGPIKFSPNGKKFISAQDIDQRLDIMDFDNSTGVLSNSISDNSWTHFGPYGVEFSPNSRYLYVDEESNDTTPVYQFDLQAGNANAIFASRIRLGYVLGGADYFAGMQLASDGKVYISSYSHNFIHCIQNPDVAGLGCNLQLMAVTLPGGTTSQLDLPQAIPPYLSTSNSFTYGHTCFGDSATFVIDQPVDSAHWDFGDPLTGPSNTSTNTAPYHIFSASGTYTITLLAFNGGTADTVTNQVVISPAPSVNLGNDTSVCGSASFILDATNAGATYLWQDGTTNATDTVTHSGLYIVTVNIGGCKSKDSINITAGAIPAITISTSTPQICSSDSAQICAPGGYAHYAWNNTTGDSCIFTSLGGNYYVTVTDANQCTAESNHLAIDVLPLPPVSISQSGDTLRVYNETNVQWYNNGVAISGATSPIFIASSQGSYTVAVTDSNGCKAVSTAVIVTGINEIQQDGIIIYPNPTAGIWQLNIDNKLVDSDMEIYDDNGRIVFKTTIRSTYLEVDLNVARGVYMMRIQTGSSNVYHKLVRL
ncbi:MAG: hypothetical protein JWO06_2902 [Bacteroidota bacterium]|nr:hypothetical protein [Bacteroidota bacterium]